MRARVNKQYSPWVLTVQTEAKNYPDKGLWFWNGRNGGFWSLCAKVEVHEGTRWILHVRTVNKIQPKERKAFALISKSEVWQSWRDGSGSQKHQWISAGSLRALRFNFPNASTQEWGTANISNVQHNLSHTWRSTVWFRNESTQTFHYSK